MCSNAPASWLGLPFTGMARYIMLSSIYTLYTLLTQKFTLELARLLITILISPSYVFYFFATPVVIYIHTYICMHTYIYKYASIWCSIFWAEINTSCPLPSGSPEYVAMKFCVNKHWYVGHGGEKRKMLKWRHVSIAHLQSIILTEN